MKKQFLKIAFVSFLTGCQYDSISYLDNNNSEEPQTILSQNNISENEYIGDDPIINYQWHLKNLKTNEVWSKYTGKGVKVGVVDSGVEWKHPDLQNNINPLLSIRYSDYSHDPSPDKNQLLTLPIESGHGTACAGIIGAVGWNGKGVIGVAPNSQIVGFNTFSTGEDADFEDALGNIDVDISNNSWGGAYSDELYDDPSAMSGIKRGIKLGRDGKGVIYTLASGNEGNNANYSTLHGSKYVFNIGAVLYDNEVPEYSNFGDNVLIVAPAGNTKFRDNKGIFTTDLTGWKYGFDTARINTKVLRSYGGDYTGMMNGTSSATPVVSGVIALMLEANPNLTYRDTKYILEKTATVYNLEISKYKWEKNSADIWFSPFYGFGIVNLVEAINMAETFDRLNDEVVVSENISVNKTIPDNNETGISSEITINENMKIEHTQIVVNIPDHKEVGDLKIELTSPSGTTSYLFFGDKKMYGVLENWELNSLKFLDENSQGVWKLKISDVKKENIGTFEDWKLVISGRKE